MRILFKIILGALSLLLTASLIGCAAQKSYMAFVYRNGGTLDITSMTASFPDGIVAKDMVTKTGSDRLARRFVVPPSWFDISWTTADGVRRERRVVLEGRYTNIKNLDGILIQVVDDRIEVFETDIGQNVWSGGRRIY
jgi:hypothetical protein